MLRRKWALVTKQENNDEFETPVFRDLMTKEHVSEETSNDDEDIDDIQDESSESDDEVEADVTELDTREEEEDSDAAPDDVGFSESRKEALSQMRDVINQIKEEKMKQKSKRKLKDEKFKEQKRLKLEALKPLPEAVINSLPEEINQPKQEVKKPESKNKKGKKKQKKEKKEASSGAPKSHITVFEENEKFIPLETGLIDSETGVQVMSLKDMRKKMAITESAANFKNSRLYGDPHKRESTKSYMAKREKKRILRTK